MSAPPTPHEEIANRGPTRSDALSPSIPHNRHHGLILFASCLVIVASGLLQVQQGERVTLPYWGNLPGVCVWKNCFHLECPGCGLTRSFIAIAHGRWKDAWQFNSAGFLIFAVVLYQIPFRSFQIYKLKKRQKGFQHPIWLINFTVWSIIGVLLLQWVTKQII